MNANIITFKSSKICYPQKKKKKAYIVLRVCFHGRAQEWVTDFVNIYIYEFKIWNRNVSTTNPGFRNVST